MSLTPEQELRRAAAWARFYEIAAEINARHNRRQEVASRLQRQGHTPEDFDDADRAMREVEKGMRQLRRAMKAVPELVSDVGCDAELQELRRSLNRLGISWRDLKSSWRYHTPRPAGDQ
jgi:hypothetical protein